MNNKEKYYLIKVAEGMPGHKSAPLPGGREKSPTDLGKLGPMISGLGKKLKTGVSDQEMPDIKGKTGTPATGWMKKLFGSRRPDLISHVRGKGGFGAGKGLAPLTDGGAPTPEVDPFADTTAPHIQNEWGADIPNPDYVAPPPRYIKNEWGADIPNPDYVAPMTKENNAPPPMGNPLPVPMLPDPVVETPAPEPIPPTPPSDDNPQVGKIDELETAVQPAQEEVQPPPAEIPQPEELGLDPSKQAAVPSWARPKPQLPIWGSHEG